MSRFVAYFDASALAKRYSREQGTELVNEIFRLLPSNARACSVIAIAEVTSTLVRMKNDRRIGEAHFASATHRFGGDWTSRWHRSSLGSGCRRADPSTWQSLSRGGGAVGRSTLLHLRPLQEGPPHDTPAAED